VLKYRIFQNYSDFFEKAKFIDLNQVFIEDRTKDFIAKFNELKELGKFKTNKELGEIIGIKTVSTISEIVALRQNIQPEQYQNFLKFYSENSVPRETYLQRRNSQKLQAVHIEKNNVFEGVPIYDVPIDASFLERYREEEFSPLYYLNIPKLRNCNFGAIISGSSMYPILKSGSIAMCRIVEDINYIDPGEMYLISTTNGFETVKYVQPGEKKDELQLIPHNEKIKPTSIKKQMIIRVCIVEAWISFR
jgi:hypothetical protein